MFKKIKLFKINLKNMFSLNMKQNYLYIYLMFYGWRYNGLKIFIILTIRTPTLLIAAKLS